MLPERQMIRNRKCAVTSRFALPGAVSRARKMRQSARRPEAGNLPAKSRQVAAAPNSHVAFLFRAAFHALV